MISEKKKSPYSSAVRVRKMNKEKGSDYKI
jgi:hypothetical protein